MDKIGTELDCDLGVGGVREINELGLLGWFGGDIVEKGWKCWFWLFTGIGGGGFGKVSIVLFKDGYNCCWLEGRPMVV